MLWNHRPIIVSIFLDRRRTYIFVKHLVVKDMIKEPMLRLQNVKMGACITIISIPYYSFGINVRLGLADAALGEGTGVKIHKLSVKEIKAVRLPSPFPAVTLTNVSFFIAFWHEPTRAAVSGAARGLNWCRWSIPRLLSLCSCWSRETKLCSAR